MRLLPIIVLSVVLAGCELVQLEQKKAINPAVLPPMSSRERALIFAADGAAQQDNFAAAERDYLTAIAASQGHIDAHLALARLYEKHLQTDKARAILENALELQPEHPMANYQMGKQQLAAFQYHDALASFQRGLKKRPDDVDLSVGEAIANDMLGKHTASQMIYLRIMRVNPKADLSNVRSNLALSYLLANQPQKAVETLQSVAEKPNASVVSRHNLALAYGLLGRHADAKKLVEGEMDEDSRQLALARLKEYLQARNDEDATPPFTPNIVDVEAEPANTPPLQKSTVSTEKPASVEASESTEEAEPAVSEPSEDAAAEDE